jgi:hypothetical protein
MRKKDGEVKKQEKERRRKVKWDGKKREKKRGKNEGKNNNKKDKKTGNEMKERKNETKQQNTRVLSLSHTLSLTLTDRQTLAAFFSSPEAATERYSSRE